MSFRDTVISEQYPYFSSNFLPLQYVLLRHLKIYWLILTDTAFGLPLLCADYPSLPRPPVAPAGGKDQGPGPGPEGSEGSAALPHTVRLCDLPQFAGVAALQPKDLWLQLR